MTKIEEMQKLIRYYKDKKGVKEVDMKDVAKFAIEEMGWSVPEPKNPVDILSNSLAKAARQETRNDKNTGRPYRANHAVNNGKQGSFWVDIDEAQRTHMQKSAVNRREQMVGDGYQLTLDLDHWNSANPEEEPIEMPMDFTDDIEWRKAAEDHHDETA